MDKPHLVFLIKELPRPKGEGAFCYRYSDRQDSGVLSYLKLIDPDMQENREAFRSGLQTLLRREHAISSDVTGWLTGYATENMQPWVQQLLQELVEELMQPHAEA